MSHIAYQLVTRTMDKTKCLRSSTGQARRFSIATCGRRDQPKRSKSAVQTANAKASCRKKLKLDDSASSDSEAFELLERISCQVPLCTQAVKSTLNSRKKGGLQETPVKKELRNRKSLIIHSDSDPDVFMETKPTPVKRKKSLKSSIWKRRKSNYIDSDGYGSSSPDILTLSSQTENGKTANCISPKSESSSDEPFTPHLIITRQKARQLSIVDEGELEAACSTPKSVEEKENVARKVKKTVEKSENIPKQSQSKNITRHSYSLRSSKSTISDMFDSFTELQEQSTNDSSDMFISDTPEKLQRKRSMTKEILEDSQSDDDVEVGRTYSFHSVCSVSGTLSTTTRGMAQTEREEEKQEEEKEREEDGVQEGEPGEEEKRVEEERVQEGELGEEGKIVEEEKSDQEAERVQEGEPGEEEPGEEERRVEVESEREEERVQEGEEQEEEDKRERNEGRTQEGEGEREEERVEEHERVQKQGTAQKDDRGSREVVQEEEEEEEEEEETEKETENQEHEKEGEKGDKQENNNKKDQDENSVERSEKTIVSDLPESNDSNKNNTPSVENPEKTITNGVPKLNFLTEESDKQSCAENVVTSSKITEFQKSKRKRKKTKDTNSEAEKVKYYYIFVNVSDDWITVVHNKVTISNRIYSFLSEGPFNNLLTLYISMSAQRGILCPAITERISDTNPNNSTIACKGSNFEKPAVKHNNNSGNLNSEKTNKRKYKSDDEQGDSASCASVNQDSNNNNSTKVYFRYCERTGKILLSRENDFEEKPPVKKTKKAKKTSYNHLNTIDGLLKQAAFQHGIYT